MASHIHACSWPSSGESGTELDTPHSEFCGRGEHTAANRRYHSDSYASKTREARLKQMRDKLVAETTEEKEARLQQMRVHQLDRLASETAKEREVWLKYCRDWRLVQSQLPLFEQHSIPTKMLRCHADMATLDSAQCSTCSELVSGTHNLY